DLVDKKKRGHAAGLLLQAGALDHLADFLDARGDRAERDEMAPARPRDEARERGLARARRTPENHRRKLSSLDRALEKASGPQELLLTEEFLEAPRTHPLGERGTLGAAPRLFRKEVQGLCHEIGVRGAGVLMPRGIGARRCGAAVRRIRRRKFPASAPALASNFEPAPGPMFRRRPPSGGPRRSPRRGGSRRSTGRAVRGRAPGRPRSEERRVGKEW